MSDGIPDDPLPAMIAELDQALAMAGQMARVLRGYFDAFKAEGFTDSQAVYLAAIQLKDNPGSPP